MEAKTPNGPLKITHGRDGLGPRDDRDESRLGVGESTSGTGYELDVIAAVVIGGTSLSGGKGSIAGAIWGAALLGVVRNGLVLLGVSDFWQTISIGAVIIVAVLIDRYRSREPV